MPAHHRNRRTEQHADRRIGEKAETDLQVGRQPEFQPHQIQRDIHRDQQRSQRQAARAFEFTQRTDKDIWSFGHRKRHLLNKFICCHSDLGDA